MVLCTTLTITNPSSVILNWITFAKWVKFPDGHSEGVPIESPCIEDIAGEDLVILFNVTVIGMGAWGADYDLEYSFITPNDVTISDTAKDNCVKSGTFTWAAEVNIRKYIVGTYTDLTGKITNVQDC